MPQASPVKFEQALAQLSDGADTQERCVTARVR